MVGATTVLVLSQLLGAAAPSEAPVIAVFDVRDDRPQAERAATATHMSTRDTAASVGVSTGVVGKCTQRATSAGLDWPAVEALDETGL